MKLHDYFMLCMKNKMYMNRKWIIRCFTIIPRDNLTDEPFMPSFENKTCSFIDDEGTKHTLDDYEFRQQLFHLTKAVTVNPGEFNYFTEKTVSSYGNMVTGMCIFEWALEGKLGFYNGNKPWNVDTLDDIVSKAIKDNVIAIEHEYKRYIQALDFCSVFTDFVVPVGNKEMFLPDQDVLKLKNELVAKYKDRLHEPAVAALVEEQVNKLDKEKMMQTNSAGFLISDKSISTVRKKLNYFQGITVDPADTTKVNFIESSVKDGWTLEDFPKMVNNVVQGSYSRSTSVALGGVATKNILRYAGNIKVGSDDCNTKLGIPILVEKFTVKDYTGRYDAITGKAIEPKAGERYIIRDPSTCQEKGGNVCRKCLGVNAGSTDAGIASQLVSFSGATLKSFLAAFHAKVIKLEKFDFESRLK